MSLRFEKWQALGNDYIIVEQETLPFELTPERVRRICAAHLGCRADGILVLARADSPDLVARLRIFNPDCSEAELSGNGAREAILYLHRAGWTTERDFSVQTAAGEIRATVTSPRTCSVAMGRAQLRSGDFPSGGPDGRGRVRAGDRDFHFRHVSIGNPQCVIDAGDELEELDLSELGPPIEHSELFPNRTNVAFVCFDDDQVRARIFERGVGETLSSGTGACAAAVTAVLNGAASPVVVGLEGGRLEVAVSDELDVTLAGWAEPVLRGEFSSEVIEALEGAA